MPIRTSSAPAGAMEALRAGLGQVRGVAEVEVAAALSADHDEPWQEGVPHPVFHLGLDAIAAGQGITTAEPVGWRYLLGESKKRPLLAAEVHRTAGDQRYSFAGLNQGPFVGQMLDVLRRAEASPEIAQRDFEPRMLRIPALYIMALWLKDRNSEKDLFIPLEPSNPVVTPGRIYTAEEFEAALRKAAEEQRSAVPPGADQREDPHAP